MRIMDVKTLALKTENSSESQSHTIMYVDDSSVENEIITLSSVESNQDAPASVDSCEESPESPLLFEVKDENVQPTTIPSERLSESWPNSVDISSPAGSDDINDCSQDAGVKILNCYSMSNTIEPSVSVESGYTSDIEGLKLVESSMTSCNSVTTKSLVFGGCLMKTTERKDFTSHSTGSHLFSLDKDGEMSGLRSSVETNKNAFEMQPCTSSSLTNTSVPNSVSINEKGRHCNTEKHPFDDTPLYSAEYQNVLEVPNKGTVRKDVGSEKSNTFNRNCFNCLGNHTVRACPRRLDFSLINKRRMDYKSQAAEKNIRYHAVSGDEFGKCKPGTISDRLRAALGLNKNELPGYIWNMRKYGYPPGWLEHARDSASGLQIYDSDTMRNLEPTPLMIKSLKDSLIEYPGFTSRVPLGYKDDGERFGIRFKEKDSLHNVAVMSTQLQQSITNRRNILNARRRGSTTVSPFPLERPEHLTMTFNSTNKESQWYDNLLSSSTTPTPYHSQNADVQAVERIYQRVILRRPIDDDVRNLTDNQLSRCQNYRITEELERREEEKAKQLAKSKPMEVDLRQREWELEQRCKSPSLLDPPTLFDSSSTWKEDIDPVVIDEDEVKILDEVPQAKKRPLDVITINSEDEGEFKKAKIDSIVPNPIYKRMKMLKQRRKSTAVSITSNLDTRAVVVNCNETIQRKSSTLPSWLLDNHETESSQSNDSSPNLVAESTELKATTADVDKLEVLATLKKHNEEFDSMTYADLPLPPIHNFAKDMQPMSFQDVNQECIGRFQTVLKVIQNKKASPVKTNTEDDDLEVIFETDNCNRKSQ